MRRTYILAAGVASLAVAGPVLAQGLPAEIGTNANGLNETGEIIVTAQKRAESLQDVPIAISAFSTEQLENRQIRTIADLQSQLPGVIFNEFSGAGNVSIRGVGLSAFSGAGENSAAIHLDGIYIAPAQAFTMVQEDLARIEVLRGPQGSLYGRNATAGVINFISAAPTPEFEGSATALVGNYSRVRGSGYVSGPLSDNVRVRLSGAADEQDKGFIFNPATSQQLEDHHNRFVRLGIDADPTRGVNLQFRGFYAHEKFAGPAYDLYDRSASPLPSIFDDFIGYEKAILKSNVFFDSTKKLAGGSLRAAVDLNDDISLVSLTGYTHFKFEAQQDALGSTFPGFTAFTRRFYQSNAFSQELNLGGRSGAIQWLLGGYLLHVKEQGRSLILLPPLPGLEYLSDSDTKRRSYSVFGDVTFHVSDRFRLFVGARHIWERLELQLFNNLDPVGCPREIATDTAFSGRAGAQYDLTADNMVYGQYARGYKGGGFSSSTCGNKFKPEEVDSIEVGFKNHFFDRRLTLNASLFHYNTKNSQVEQLVGPTAIVQNANSETWGAEVEFVARPFGGLQFDGSLSLLDAKYKDFLSTDGSLFDTFGLGVAPGTNLKGGQPNRSPKRVVNLGVQYAVQTSIGTFTPRAEWQSSTSYVIRELRTAVTTQKAYTISNFYFDYKAPGGKVRASLFLKNAGSTRTLGNAIIFGGPLGSFSAPRTYGGQFSVDF